MMLAKSGKKVAMIEKYGEIGGGCTHWGTIPSKALREAAYLASRFAGRGMREAVQTRGRLPSSFLTEALACEKHVIESQESMLLSQLMAAGVTLGEVAEGLGVTRQAVSQYLRGIDRPHPALEAELARLSDPDTAAAIVALIPKEAA